MREILNERQATVLAWVADGCPAGIMEGEGHKVSAAALRSRGLIRTSGSGARWRAELTERGRAHLSHPDAAEHPRATRNGRQTRPVPRADGAGEQRVQSLLKTERLVADVVAAGGVLRLTDETATGGVNYRQRAYAGQRHGNVPAGKHLTVSRGRDGFTISLVDGATGNELGAEAARVPARVTRHHRVAQQLRDRTELHEVSRKALPRMLRIVHALAHEIERRGHQIECVAAPADSHARSGWKPTRDGQLVVTINGHSNPLRNLGEGRRAARAVGVPEEALGGGPRVAPVRPVLSALLGVGRRQQGWGDRKRWRLEDRLPQLVRELEVQAAEAEERRLTREREQAERQRQWEAAMAHAKRRFLAAHRREVLLQRVSAWRDAEAIRNYCDAVETRHGADTIAPTLDPVRGSHSLAKKRNACKRCRRCLPIPRSVPRHFRRSSEG